MISVPRKVRQHVFGVLSVLTLFTRVLYAEEISIRHELTPAFSWSSYEHSYDTYVINRVDYPLISGRFESDFQQNSMQYSFFFTPISDELQIPIRLQQFYAHPTTLRVNFNLRPEYEASRIFQNQGQAYRVSTSYTLQSRRAGLELELYPWKNTGITLLLDSAKDEEQLSSSNTLGIRTSGNSDEIQRHYGLGLTQYFTANIRCHVGYTVLDGEYVSVGNSWEEGSPLLSTEIGVESEADGRELQLAGTYIVHNLFSVRGGYRHHNSDSHFDTMTSSYDNFSAGKSFYDDETTDHSLTAAVEWFFGKNTSLQLGGGFSRYELKRIYETDQNVLYAWDTWSVNTGFSHYVNRHLGFWLSYEFAARDGSVETWHPDAENDPRTTFQTRSDLHTLQAGFRIDM